MLRRAQSSLRNAIDLGRLTLGSGLILGMGGCSDELTLLVLDVGESAANALVQGWLDLLFQGFLPDPQT